ncbi:MAG: hypothetical protein K6G50_08400 [bacterium]|nr:hypothetical protein [bacterium]
MQELGRIEPVKRMACPNCHELLDDEVLEPALDGEAVPCPHCGSPIRLPREVVERHQQSKYLGTALDIMC